MQAVQPKSHCIQAFHSIHSRLVFEAHCVTSELPRALVTLGDHPNAVPFLCRSLRTQTLLQIDNPSAPAGPSAQTPSAAKDASPDPSCRGHSPLRRADRCPEMSMLHKERMPFKEVWDGQGLSQPLPRPHAFTRHYCTGHLGDLSVRKSRPSTRPRQRPRRTQKSSQE